MPLPRVVAVWNKRYLNKVLVHLAGHGLFVELEHVGRRTGAVYRVPLVAIRHGDHVTVALTYGTEVDWLKNLRAARGGRMHLGHSLVLLGPPRTLAPAEGLRRMPAGARQILSLTRTRDFVEFVIESEAPFSGW